MPKKYLVATYLIPRMCLVWWNYCHISQSSDIVMMLQGFRNLGLVLNSGYLPVRDYRYVLVAAFILVDKDAYATGVGIWEG